MGVVIRKASRFFAYYNNFLFPPQVVDMETGKVFSLTEFQGKNLFIGYAGEQECLRDYAKKQAKKLQITRFTFDNEEVGINIELVRQRLWHLWKGGNIPANLARLIGSLQQKEMINLWILTEADKPMAEMVKKFLLWGSENGH